MKLIILLAYSIAVQANQPFWYPINNFFDEIANKTIEINNFMKDQNTKFIENVNNGTKNVGEIIVTQKQKMDRNIESYEDNITKANDEVFIHFKNTTKRLENNFKTYVQSSTDFWSLFTQSEEAEKMKNREAELSTPAMIAANGYPCESHTVVTADGYILTLHRIPKSPNGVQSDSSKTVLLQHGLLASSADWVFAGPERSLAYLLSDAGYDVWMGNVRGNRYSREHVTWKTDSVRYWNFSWHEIATEDLPAIIDYIQETKKSEDKITYIGHSMGTTLLFALLSSRPEYNDKLSAGFALAPVVFMKNVRGPVKSLAPYSFNLEYVSTILGRQEFLPRKPGRGWLGSDSCDDTSLDSVTCRNFISMICGVDDDQLDTNMLPVFLAHIGSGTSVKTVVHFSQEIISEGKFQQFDYGSAHNAKVYGVEKPPEYDLDNVRIPIALFSGKNDPLSSEVDVMELYERLKCEKELIPVPFEKFNHLDYLWAKDVKKLLYGKLLEMVDYRNY